jgi:hypothetical protein
MILKHGGSLGLYATFEHVKARSTGGTFKAENVPLSHGTCNNRRGTFGFEEYREKVKNNGGKPPRLVIGKDSIKSIMIDRAKKGFDDGLEYLLAKKLNAALYVFQIEEHIIPCPSSVDVVWLLERVERPIQL